MQNFKLKETESGLNLCEESLLRKGEIITPIGVFRAVMANNGILEREHFNFLVKKNNFLEVDDELSKDILLKIKQVWQRTRDFLKDLNILEEFKEEKIRIKNPKDFFFI